MLIKNNREYLIIFNDKNKLEIRIPLFPPLINFKKKGKKILNGITFEQKLRNTSDFFEDSLK